MEINHHITVHSLAEDNETERETTLHTTGEAEGGLVNLDFSDPVSAAYLSLDDAEVLGNTLLKTVKDLREMNSAV